MVALGVPELKSVELDFNGDYDIGGYGASGDYVYSMDLVSRKTGGKSRKYLVKDRGGSFTIHSRKADAVEKARARGSLPTTKDEVNRYMKAKGLPYYVSNWRRESVSTTTKTPTQKSTAKPAAQEEGCALAIGLICVLVAIMSAFALL